MRYNNCNNCKKECQTDFIICPWCKGDITGMCKGCETIKQLVAFYSCGHCACQECTTAGYPRKCIKKNCTNKYFKCKYDTYDFIGRYRATTPMNAARRALSMIVSKNELRDVNIDFELKEVTRGSNRQIYKFSGISKKLEQPKVVKVMAQDFNGNLMQKYISYRYKNYVTQQ